MSLIISALLAWFVGAEPNSRTFSILLGQCSFPDCDGVFTGSSDPGCAVSVTTTAGLRTSFFTGFVNNVNTPNFNANLNFGLQGKNATIIFSCDDDDGAGFKENLGIGTFTNVLVQSWNGDEDTIAARAETLARGCGSPNAVVRYIPSWEITAPDPPIVTNALSQTTTSLEVQFNRPVYTGGRKIVAFFARYRLLGSTTLLSQGVRCDAVNVTTTPFRCNITVSSEFSGQPVEVFVGLNTTAPAALSSAIAASRIVTVLSAPGQPSITNVGVTPFTAVLTWAPPVFTGGATLEKFKVELRLQTDLDFGNLTQIVNGTTATFAGLLPGRVYVARVSAKNVLVNAFGPASPDRTFSTLKTTPDAPLNLRTAAFTFDTLTLAWDLPANGGDVITTFELTVRDSTNNTVVGVFVLSGTQQLVSNLVPIRRYAWQVRAANGAVGFGPLSFANSTTGALPPGQPLNLVVSNVRAFQATVSWVAPTFDGGKPLTAFIISFVPVRAGPTVTLNNLSPTLTSADVTGLLPATEYIASVFARNVDSISLPATDALRTLGPVVDPNSFHIVKNALNVSQNIPPTAGLLTVDSCLGGTVIEFSATDLTTFGAPSVSFGPLLASGDVAEQFACTVISISANNQTFQCRVGPGTGTGHSLVFRSGAAQALSVAVLLGYPGPILTAGTLDRPPFVSNTGSLRSLPPGLNNKAEVIGFRGLNFGTDLSVMSVKYGPASDPTLFTCLVTEGSRNDLISCVTEAGIGTQLPLTVNINGQSAVSVDLYNYPTAPRVDNVSGCDDQADGTTINCPTEGGREITIRGADMLEATIAIQGANCLVTSINAVGSVVTCLLPPGAGQFLSITAQNNNQGGKLSLLSYAEPVITAVTGCVPAANSSLPSNCNRAGGDLLVVSGVNFGPPGARVLVGGSPCISSTQDPLTAHVEAVCVMPSGTGALRAVTILQFRGSLSVEVANARISYELCVPGTFAVGIDCQPCAPGTFRDELCADACFPCPRGTRANQALGATACEPCEQGTFGDSTGLLQCTVCPEGTAQLEFGRTTCVECAAGRFSATNGTIFCDLCPEGEFQSLAGQAGCLPCAPGTFSAQQGLSACEVCPLGKSGGGGDRNSCEVCPPGSVQPELGQVTCILCEEGKFAADAGQIACESCPAGRAGNDTGLAACFECLPGTFQAQRTAVECNPCVAGTTSPAAAELCTPCGVNEVRGEFDGADCQPCLANSKENLAHTACLCNVGFYQKLTDLPFQTGREPCVKCPRGFVCNVAGLTSATVLLAKGFWRELDSFQPDTCLLKSHCKGGPAGDAGCAGARIGVLCAECDIGFQAATRSSDCTACPSQPVAILFATIFFLVALGAFGFCVYIVLKADKKLVKNIISQRDDRKMMRAGSRVKGLTSAGWVDAAPNEKAIVPMENENVYEYDTADQSAMDTTGQPAPPDHEPDQSRLDATGRSKTLAEQVNASARMRAASLGLTYRQQNEVVGVKSGGLLGQQVLTPEAAYKPTILYSLKIVVGFLQIIVKLSFIAVVPWPDTFIRFLGFFNFINLDFLPWSTLSCIVSDYTFYDRSVILYCLPGALLLFMLCGFWLPSLLRDNRDFSDDGIARRTRIVHRLQFQKLCLWCLFLVYPTLCSAVFAPFFCRKVNGVAYLIEDFSIDCNSKQHEAFLLPSGIMILVYPLGVPLLFLACLLKNRNTLDSDETKVSIGFIYYAYRVGCWWWEILDMAHKLALVSLVRFIPAEQVTQSAMVIAVFYVICLLLFSPYTRDGDDRLHILCQTEIFLMLMSGSVVAFEGGEISQLEDAVISSMLIALTLALLVLFIIRSFAVSRALVNRYRRKKVAKRNAKLQKRVEDNLAADTPDEQMSGKLDAVGAKERKPSEPAADRHRAASMTMAFVEDEEDLPNLPTFRAV